VSVIWEKPLNDGGCSILSYHLYIRELSDTAWTEVDPLLINDRPLLNEYEIDTSMFTIGHYYSLKLTVWNKVGDVTSDTVVFKLADVPG
jgi:hypothetical protein